MKLSKKIAAALISMAMMLSMAACNGDDKEKDDDKDAKPAATEKAGENGKAGETKGATDGAEAGGDGEYWEAEIPTAVTELNFGFVAFNNREFTILADTDIKVGGNKGEKPGDDEGGGAADAINILGFQGYPKPDAGFPGDDPDGEWLTLVSQNGEFWDNISKIEATLFLEPGDDAPDMSPEEVSNIEAFFQGGAKLKYNWGQTNINLLEQFNAAINPDATGFKWGTPVTVTWDFDGYKEGLDEGKKAVWADPATPKDEADPESDKEGGGINKFGIQIQTDNVLDDISGKLSWVDATVYVHDLAKYNAFIEEFKTKTNVEPSANTADKVVEVGAE